MPALDLDPVALDHAFAVADQRVQDGTLPFVILGVANAGGVIRLEATTAPGQPRRIGTDAVCLLASITKPIVATATMRLAQEGRFGLAVPLVTWLPELAGGGRDTITAWHVLTHTTGLDDGTLEQLLRAGMDRAELHARTFAQPLAAPVGSRYKYATFTFDLLAEALERALARPIEAILHETVLDPLDMADTGFDPGPDRAPRQAPVTIGEWDGTRLVGFEDPAVAAVMRQRFTSLQLAGGGLWSTAHDLLRFGRAMLRGGELDGERILGSSFVDLATREVDRRRPGSRRGPPARRALRDRLGEARSGAPRLGALVRARRRVGDAAVDRARARPRDRLPQRRLGPAQPGDRRDDRGGVRGGPVAGPARAGEAAAGLTATGRTTRAAPARRRDRGGRGRHPAGRP